MHNLIKIELYKLKTSKIFYLLLGVSMLQSVVVYLYSQTFTKLTGLKSIDFMIGMQTGLAQYILMGVLASDYIVTEFSSGYIKNLVSYGHSRKNIFISKSITYYMAVLLMSFLPVAVMTIINTTANGLGAANSTNTIIYILNNMLLIAFVYIAISSTCILVAFTTKNVNATIVITFMLDMFNRVLNVMSVQIKGTAPIYQLSVFSAPGVILMDNVSKATVLHMMMLALFTLIVAITLSLYLFCKRDI